MCHRFLFCFVLCSWKVYFLFIYFVFFLSFQVPPSLQSNWPQLYIGLLLHLSCWGPRSLAKQRVQVSLPKEIIISPTFFARPQSRAGRLEGLSGAQRGSVRAGCWPRPQPGTLRTPSLARQPALASSISTTVLGCVSFLPVLFQFCYRTEIRRLEFALVPSASCNGEGTEE